MRAGSYAGDDVGGTRRSSQKTDAKTSKSRELAKRGFVLFSTATPHRLVESHATCANLKKAHSLLVSIQQIGASMKPISRSFLLSMVIPKPKSAISSPNLVPGDSISPILLKMGF